MAGDEQRLRDARITVKLDLAEARRKLDELEGGSGERSGAGKRPPSPGRRDERKEREDEARRERLRPKGGRSRAAAVAGAGVSARGGKLGRAVIGAIKIGGAAAAVTFSADVIRGAIESEMGKVVSAGPAPNWVTDFPAFLSWIGDFAEEKGAKAAQSVFEGTLGITADVIRALATIAPIIASFVGTATDQAKTQAILFPEGPNIGGAMRIAQRAAAVTGARVSIGKQQAMIAHGALGAAGANDINDFRAHLFKNADTSR